MMRTQPNLCRRIGRLSSALALIAVFLAPPVFAETAETAEFPRMTMQALFEDIKTLIPLSMREERWRSEKDRDAILTALARLEKSADALERHGRDREAGFSQIALNLMGDFSDTYEFYRTGRYDEARFFFSGSLQSCVSCHVRLSTEKSFPLANELMDASPLEELVPRDRAWMLVTVRRFDEALSTWEDLLRDKNLSAAQLDSSGVLVDYLNVALRVRGDIDRVSKTLTEFAARPDLPVYLAVRVGEWQSALANLKQRHFKPDRPGSLKRGIKLAAEAGSVADGPYGRDALVQDLAAASHLVRWLEQDHARRRDGKLKRNLTDTERDRLARAYYWLGIVEARSLDGFWVNQSEQHFEAAIRADPKGPTAKKAYSILEETQVLGYGGSSGVHLPVDVWTLLKELRDLMGIEP